MKSSGVGFCWAALMTAPASYVAACSDFCFFMVQSWWACVSRGPPMFNVQLASQLSAAVTHGQLCSCASAVPSFLIPDFVYLSPLSLCLGEFG